MGKQMKEVFEREAALKLSKEVAKLALEKNLTIREAETRVLEKYKKAQYLTGQDKGIEHSNKFNGIIPLGTDIDNGYIYDKETGETIKDS